MSKVSKEVKDIEVGLRNMASRIARAEENFIEVLMERGGITSSEAENVYRVYQKLKVLKRDAVGGTIRVTHGGLLDRAVIREALRARDL